LTAITMEKEGEEEICRQERRFAMSNKGSG
jgi:hypothetical protein